MKYPYFLWAISFVGFIFGIVALEYAGFPAISFFATLITLACMVAIPVIGLKE